MQSTREQLKSVPADNFVDSFHRILIPGVLTTLVEEKDSPVVKQLQDLLTNHKEDVKKYLIHVAKLSDYKGDLDDISQRALFSFKPLFDVLTLAMLKSKLQKIGFPNPDAFAAELYKIPDGIRQANIARAGAKDAAAGIAAPASILAVAAPSGAPELEDPFSDDEPAAAAVAQIDDDEPTAAAVAQIDDDEPTAAAVAQINDDEPAAAAVAQIDDDEPAAAADPTALAGVGHAIPLTDEQQLVENIIVAIQNRIDQPVNSPSLDFKQTDMDGRTRELILAFLNKEPMVHFSSEMKQAVLLDPFLSQIEYKNKFNINFPANFEIPDQKHVPDDELRATLSDASFQSALMELRQQLESEVQIANRKYALAEAKVEIASDMRAKWEIEHPEDSVERDVIAIAAAGQRVMASLESIPTLTAIDNQSIVDYFVKLQDHRKQFENEITLEIAYLESAKELLKMQTRSFTRPIPPGVSESFQVVKDYIDRIEQSITAARGTIAGRVSERLIQAHRHIDTTLLTIANQTSTSIQRALTLVSEEHEPAEIDGPTVSERRKQFKKVENDYKNFIVRTTHELKFAKNLRDSLSKILDGVERELSQEVKDSVAATRALFTPELDAKEATLKASLGEFKRAQEAKIVEAETKIVGDLLARYLGSNFDCYPEFSVITQEAKHGGGNSPIQQELLSDNVRPLLVAICEHPANNLDNDTKRAEFLGAILDTDISETDRVDLLDKTTKCLSADEKAKFIRSIEGLRNAALAQKARLADIFIDKVIKELKGTPPTEREIIEAKRSGVELLETLPDYSRPDLARILKDDANVRDALFRSGLKGNLNVEDMAGTLEDLLKPELLDEAKVLAQVTDLGFDRPKTITQTILKLNHTANPSEVLGYREAFEAAKAHTLLLSTNSSIVRQIKAAQYQAEHSGNPAIREKAKSEWADHWKSQQEVKKELFNELTALRENLNKQNDKLGSVIEALKTAGLITTPRAKTPPFDKYIKVAQDADEAKINNILLEVKGGYTLDNLTNDGNLFLAKSISSANSSVKKALNDLDGRLRALEEELSHLEELGVKITNISRLEGSHSALKKSDNFKYTDFNDFCNKVQIEANAAPSPAVGMLAAPDTALAKEDKEVSTLAVGNLVGFMGDIPSGNASGGGLISSKGLIMYNPLYNRVQFLMEHSSAAHPHLKQKDFWSGLKPKDAINQAALEKYIARTATEKGISLGVLGSYRAASRIMDAFRHEFMQPKNPELYQDELVESYIKMVLARAAQYPGQPFTLSGSSIVDVNLARIACKALEICLGNLPEFTPNDIATFPKPTPKQIEQGRELAAKIIMLDKNSPDPDPHLQNAVLSGMQKGPKDLMPKDVPIEKSRAQLKYVSDTRSANLPGMDEPADQKITGKRI